MLIQQRENLCVRKMWVHRDSGTGEGPGASRAWQVTAAGPGGQEWLCGVSVPEQSSQTCPLPGCHGLPCSRGTSLLFRLQLCQAFPAFSHSWTDLWYLVLPVPPSAACSCSWATAHSKCCLSQWQKEKALKPANVTYSYFTYTSHVLCKAFPTHPEAGELCWTAHPELQHFFTTSKQLPRDSWAAPSFPHSLPPSLPPSFPSVQLLFSSLHPYILL